jgi:hypothetical protein
MSLFTVKRESVHTHEGKALRWMVELPHQCDAWEVAFGTKEEAITMLTEFIAEAQAALEALVGERETS